MSIVKHIIFTNEPKNEVPNASSLFICGYNVFRNLLWTLIDFFYLCLIVYLKA